MREMIGGGREAGWRGPGCRGERRIEGERSERGAGRVGFERSGLLMRLLVTSVCDRRESRGAAGGPRQEVRDEAAEGRGQGMAVKGCSQPSAGPSRSSALQAIQSGAVDALPFEARARQRAARGRDQIATEGGAHEGAVVVVGGLLEAGRLPLADAGNARSPPTATKRIGRARSSQRRRAREGRRAAAACSTTAAQAAAKAGC